MKNVFFLVTVAIVVFTTSCGDEPTDGNEDKLEFTSLQPAIAWHGDTITITGKNFGTLANDITILFDTVSFITIKPVSVSNNIVRAIIPVATKERVYRVTLGKKKKTIAAGSIIIAYNMAITSVSPTRAWRGDTIVITGRKFDSTVADISILLDSLTLKPISVKNDNIRFIVPQTIVARLYTVVVRKKNESATAAHQIIMSNPKQMSITTVQPLKAWRYDTIAITGSNFGTTKTDIIVLFDSLVATPVSVSDDIIKVLVPKEVIAKSYVITVRKVDESIMAAQQIVMEAGKFQFLKAIIEVRLSGIVRRYKVNQSSPSGGPSTKTTTIDTLLGPWKTSQKFEQCIGDYPSCYKNYTPPAIAICCSTYYAPNRYEEMFSVIGVPDTTSMIIPRFEASYKTKSIFEATRHHSTRNSIFSVSLQSAHYTEIPEGIIIYYTGAMLTDVSPVVVSSLNEQYNGLQSGIIIDNYNEEKFYPSATYAPDDYIKIILYR